jgi:predicted nucleic acid-binding protein
VLILDTNVISEILRQRSSGRPISQFDAMIAAIVRLHGAKLVTRNTSDFENCGIEMVNPWES